MLIFDFDGVLIDSLDEVVVNSFNAITGETLTRLDQLPGQYAKLLRANRHLVQPAGDFIVLARWCLSHANDSELSLLTTDQWQVLLRQSEQSLSERRDLFFSCRTRLIEAAGPLWFALNSPYQPLFEFLQHQDLNSIPILTNKNRQAVLKLFDYFKLPIPDSHIFSGETGISKAENFKKIRALFPRVTAWHFVDDSVPNLIEVDKDLGQEQKPQMILASWGYLGPRDSEIARQHRYQVFSQIELIEFMRASKGSVKSQLAPFG